MSHPSKVKGRTFEREVVQDFQNAGLHAERAWGSDGRSKGWHEEVDMVATSELDPSKRTALLRAQLKRRKKLPNILRPSENVDVQIVREDFGTTYVICPLPLFINLMKTAKV